MFWLITALLFFPVIYLLARPLLSLGKAHPQKGRSDKLYDYYLLELSQERNLQLISEQEYMQAKQALSTVQKFSDDLSPPSVKRHLIGAFMITIFVVAASIGAYLARSNGYEMMITMQEIQKGVESLHNTITQSKLELEQNPDDVTAWMLLVEAYKALNQHDEAVKAYAELERLNVLRTDDQLIEYVETLLLADSNPEKARSLLERIILNSPDNRIALFLYGTLEFNQGTYQAAIKRWETLYALAGDEMQGKWRNELLSMIERAKEHADKLSATTASAAKQSLLQKAEQTTNGITNPVLEISVNLDPKIVKQAVDQDSVFVYARAVDGPPMPLAVKRLIVADLPHTFTFSDADAMLPNMLLSSFPQVQVFARVSKSGQAKQQPGDLVGRSGAISLTDTQQVIPVTVRITEIVKQ